MPLWRLFQKFEPSMIKVYRKLTQPPTPNLEADRDIEYSWVSANIPPGPGEALDFGCGSGWMGLLAVRKGYKVMAVDLQPVEWLYRHPALCFVQGDIFELNFSGGEFDLIINCSTIEHIGLSERYGIKESRFDADIEAMALLKKLLKPSKIMILTIPVGQDRVFYPLHRVYGKKRLPRLLSGWKVLEKEYWVKDDFNRWIEMEESESLNKEPKAHCYGLGLFVLQC